MKPPIHNIEARARPLAQPRAAPPEPCGGMRLVVGGGRQLAGLADAPPRPAVALPRRGTAPDDAAGAGTRQRAGQGGTRRLEDGLAGLLAAFDGALAEDQARPRRDAVVAALNGLLGDHLLRSGHPLALPMQLRQGGRLLDPEALATPVAGHVLLLVHELCMGDLGWCRDGHDHGQALGRALGAAPLYAFYNSGLHIGRNGWALAEQLEQLLARWPVALARISIIGHGMGGLVARSACTQAEAAGHRWPARLRQMVFLGTPHLGLPLARAGHWLHRVMDLSPGKPPFSQLSGLRSEGLRDLCSGRLFGGELRVGPGIDAPGRRKQVPLPMAVDCHAIAGTAGGPGRWGSMQGDGLVPVASALGRHRVAALGLGLADTHCWVGHGIRHLELLSDPVVYRKMLGWLQAPA